MVMSSNPFVYGRPVRRMADLADRESEKHGLAMDARSGQPDIVYAPRRYGKTSLVRVVAEHLAAEDAMPYVYADLWGARSVTDLVEILGAAYARASGLHRVGRWLAEVLGSSGFEVSVGGVISVRYVGSSEEGSDRRALRELLRVPEALAGRSPGGRLLLVLDEFGELNDVPGEPDAMMRAAFQDSPNVSFVFTGSKRSLIDSLFVDRKRPFYNFGRRLELGRLPREELGEFIERKFAEAGARIREGATDLLLEVGEGHPYRSQQLAHHALNLTSADAAADEEVVLEAKDAVLSEAAEEFRAVLDGMTAPQRALYTAVCREPTDEIYSKPYMRRHGLRGSGSTRSALESLADSGELETVRGRAPRPTDPLFAAWVRERRGRTEPDP